MAFHGWHRSLALGLLTTAALSSWQLAAETSTGVRPLTPGVLQEAWLAPDQHHTYDLQVTSEARFRVRLEQIGIDVQLVLDGPSMAEPWQVDSPIDWDGTELLLLPETGDSPLHLEIRWLGSRRLPKSATGPYRLRLDPIDGTDAEAQLRLDALKAMTLAGRAWAAGRGEDRRRALDHYRTSVDLWRRLRQPRLAAQSLYSTAVLHRLLGESEPALRLARQVLPLWQGLQDDQREADTLNEIGLLEIAAGRYDAARAALGEALRSQQRAGDLYRQVATSNNLCRTFNREGLYPQARDCFHGALERALEAGDDDSEAVIHHNLARAEQLLGQPEAALQHYRSALELQRAAGRHKRVAEILNSLAGLHRSVNEPEEALRLYLQALHSFRQVGARRWEARTLHNLGDTYHSLGDPERAVTLYENALQMRRELKDLAGEAVELRSLGRIELRSGQPQEARDLFQRALEIEQTAGHQVGEGLTWSLLGEAAAVLQEPEAALDLFARAIERMRRLDTRPRLARALSGQGKTLLALGQVAEASAALKEALELYRQLGYPRGQMEALYLLAETRRAAGDVEQAQALVEEALRGLESARAGLEDADLWATFAGTFRDAFDLHIDLLIDRGSVPEALEVSERARAWGLLELLRQAGHADLARQNSGDAAAGRTARRRLHALAGQHRQALADPASKPSAAALETELLIALADVERLEAEARRADPGRAALMRPLPPQAAEIRRLLDPQTALVEYALGRDRGFAFLVTQDRIRVFELPPREQLEKAVRRLHPALSSPHDAVADADRWAAELSQSLLAPVLAELETSSPDVERLVVVADGALHYLPFAALPLPTSSDADLHPLIHRWEVIHLPSASALVEERRRRRTRAPATHSVAVLADPVFEANDARLRGLGQLRPEAVASFEPSSPSLRWAHGLELPRLLTSRREAEIIAALVRTQGPNSEPLVALDFAADLDLVLEGRLAPYRILHFATHGVIDARYPVLSGLVLSRFDASARPRDGFLRLRDIYNLELSADLVVLSACSTALGKEVRGEGLVGLTRGFLHAGASRVLASLWPVSDRSTAELMERFYRALLEDHQPPPAALRQAQLSMLAERRWRDPHHWAGFVLIGDWANGGFMKVLYESGGVSPSPVIVNVSSRFPGWETPFVRGSSDR